MQINFDNIHSTEVSATVKKELQLGNKFSSHYKSEHFIGQETKRAIENSRTIIAENITSFPGEIIFTPDYLQSYLLIFKLLKSLGTTTFITSETENDDLLSVLTFFAEENEIDLIFLDYSNYGLLDLDGFENSLKSTRNSAVFLSHINLYSGYLLPVKKMTKLCSKYKSIFALDISNTIIHFPINIKSLDIDIAFFSPSKFHGFSGIQALYLKSKLMSDADFYKLFYSSKRELFTSNPILVKSFEVSLTELKSSREIVTSHFNHLKKHLLINIQKLSLDIEILGYESNKTLNNLMILSLPSSEFWLQRFDMEGIAIYILPTIGKEFHEIKNRSLIVISFSKYNTVQELDYFSEVLLKLL